MKEDLQDLENVGSEELSSEEICEEMISEDANQDNTEESNVNDVDDTMNEQIVQEEIPNIQKGVDIYVENDISSLESMLGIKHESIIDEVEVIHTITCIFYQLCKLSSIRNILSCVVISIRSI